MSNKPTADATELAHLKKRIAELEARDADNSRENERKLLKICHTATNINDLIRFLLQFFQDLTGCEAVGLRLRQGEDFPYYETRGFSESFTRAENFLCSRDSHGGLLRDNYGNPVLDCMCGNIICDRFDPAKPFFSPGGSFWSNCTSELLATTSEADRQARTRNRCNGEGYESVALIPLRIQEKTFGLFQFNDREKGRFGPEFITQLEELVSYVALALDKHLTDEALRENEHLLKVSQRLAKSGGWQWDVLKQTMTWTEETYRIHEIDPKELTQGSPRHITLSPACYSPEDWPKILAAFQRCIESGESYDLEFPFTTGKGRQLWIRTTAEAVWAEGRVVRVMGNIMDITERKLVELKLKENEVAIRAILDSSPETISMIDTSGTILMANKIMASRLQRSVEDLIGRSAYDFIPVDIARQRQESVRQVVETGQPFVLVDERDGLIIESHLSPVFDEAGRVSRIALFALDITDRQKAADLLAARLRLSEASVVLNMEALLTMALDEAEMLSGSRIGFFHFYDDDQQTISLQAWSTATAKTFCSAEGTGLHYNLEAAGVWADSIRQGRVVVHNDYAGLPHRKDLPAGHAEITRELLVPVLRNERVVGILGVGNKARDYTEKDIEFASTMADLVWDIVLRKQAEDALRESEQRFRALAGLAPVGIYLTSPDGQCQYANPRWCEMAGLTQEEALSNGWITGLHPDDRAMVYGAWQQMVESEGHWGLEYRFQTPAGKTTWVFGLASAQRDEAGRIIRYIGINTDISERREAEEQIKSLAIFPILNPAPTFRLDDKGVVILANPKAVELGIKPGAGVAEVLPITATIDWSTCITSGQKLILESDIHGSFFQFSIHGESQLGFAQIYGADITGRRQAEEALRATLAEKDVLLREVHHRVKNNMAAIIGLFDLQRQAMDDPQTRTVLAELSSRVRAMSLVHEKLYRSESLARIHFQEYIQSLISHLRTSFGSPGIRCEVAALGVEMPLDLAVPCGMIINELVTNALKYAFPQEIPGPSDKDDRILVAMGHDGGTFSLSVADNGVGLPPGFDLSTVKTLGLVLVRMLGQHQLAGRYEVDQVGGTRFKLTFSLRNGRKAHD